MAHPGISCGGGQSSNFRIPNCQFRGCQGSNSNKAINRWQDKLKCCYCWGHWNGRLILVLLKPLPKKRQIIKSWVVVLSRNVLLWRFMQWHKNAGIFLILLLGFGIAVMHIYLSFFLSFLVKFTHHRCWVLHCAIYIMPTSYKHLNSIQRPGTPKYIWRHDVMCDAFISIAQP